MRREHYQPTISDRDNREDWKAKGGKQIWESAAEKVKELLATDGYGLPGHIKSQVL